LGPWQWPGDGKDGRAVWGLAAGEAAESDGAGTRWSNLGASIADDHGHGGALTRGLKGKKAAAAGVRVR
jgi:hypothetical protein